MVRQGVCKSGLPASQIDVGCPIRKSSTAIKEQRGDNEM